MKTDTKLNIIKYVRMHPGTHTGEIVKYFGIHPTAVHRHLLQLISEGILFKVGKPPDVRYYSVVSTMETDSRVLSDALNFAMSGNQHFVVSEYISATRDIFQERTVHFLNTLKRELPENIAYLLVALIGEIGNNAFDHNIGSWIDVMGVYGTISSATREIVIADRGQGILTTLKRVRPILKSHGEALTVALTEIISGRAPEARGNGLKFVKKVVEENNLHLKLYSGDAKVDVTGSGMRITESKMFVPGTVAYIHY